MRDYQQSGESGTFRDMLRRLHESGHLFTESAKQEVAENIFLAMQREDVSRADLARRLGKSRAYVTQILQGGVNFTIESLVRIAIVLNCELDLRLNPRTMVEYWNLEQQNGQGYPDRTELTRCSEVSDDQKAANSNELALAA